LRGSGFSQEGRSERRKEAQKRIRDSRQRSDVHLSFILKEETVKKLILVACILIAVVAMNVSAQKWTIGVDQLWFKNPYATVMVSEFKKYGEAKGLNMIILDAELNIEKEAHNIDILIDKNVDGFIFTPVDAEASKGLVKKMVATGKPVVNCNSRINDAASLGVRAFAGPDSYLQAQAIARAAGKLKPDARVVIATGTPGYEASINREKGFTDTAAKEFPKMKILAIQTANWSREETQRVTSDFITKFGKKIDMVYCADDNMSVGAVNAFKAAGYTKSNRPLFVSLTAMPEFMQLIKEGWADLTCVQSPREDIHLAIDAMILLLQGKQKEPYKEYLMANEIVDKSNIQKVIDMHIWD
jgi:inositol transport system substrate-binding protein